MDLKTLIPEYFFTGVLILLSICLCIFCITYNNNEIFKSIWNMVINLPTLLMIALGILSVTFSTSLGASNNTFSTQIFKRYEIKARKESLEKILNNNPEYLNLPFIKQHINKYNDFLSSKGVSDLFSLLRAYLNIHGKDISNKLTFHSNDIRFCRGIIIPNFLLSIIIPYSAYLRFDNFILSFFLFSILFISTIGIFNAYKSRLKWMQEFTLRSYYAVYTSSDSSIKYFNRLVIVLVGPTGSGKSKLACALEKRCKNITRIPKSTTRPKRREEEYCIDYRFISEDDFKRFNNESEFVSVKNSEFDSYKYGILREDFFKSNSDIILTGHSLQGLTTLIKDLRNIGANNIITIHVIVDLNLSENKLIKTNQQRINRFKIEDKLQKELLSADPSILQYYVENKDSNIFALNDIWEIIKYERSKKNIAHCQKYDYEIVKKNKRDGKIIKSNGTLKT